MLTSISVSRAQTSSSLGFPFWLTCRWERNALADWGRLIGVCRTGSEIKLTSSKLVPAQKLVGRLWGSLMLVLMNWRICRCLNVNTCSYCSLSAVCCSSSSRRCCSWRSVRAIIMSERLPSCSRTVEGTLTLGSGHSEGTRSEEGTLAGRGRALPRLSLPPFLKVRMSLIKFYGEGDKD